MLLVCAGISCRLWLRHPSSVTQPVVIDVTRLVGRYFDRRHPTGVDRVSLAYLQHYAPIARLMLRWYGLSGLFSADVSLRIIDVLLRWSSLEHLVLQKLIARGVLTSIGCGHAHGAVLMHTGHNDAELASLWNSIRWHHVRPVFFVHDLIPLTHPQYCREGEFARHRQRLQRMLRGAGIVANSQHTLHQLAHFAREQSVGMPPHCVALLAPPHAYIEKLAAAKLDEGTKTKQNVPREPYFLVVGTIEPRKNHALLLQVWQHMLQTLPINQIPKLVVIGQPGWDSMEVETQLQSTQQFQSCVQWIAQCDDASLVQWMQAACALLFPSFAEGFGMPMAEALLAGTPVIASDLAVFREVAGDVPDYLPTDDVQGWTQAILGYAAKESGMRCAQLQRMQSWQAPAWDAHFSHVDTLLASLPALS
jgi:glycosyltransferase involved in cell wall biosynthesis